MTFDWPQTPQDGLCGPGGVLVSDGGYGLRRLTGESGFRTENPCCSRFREDTEDGAWFDHFFLSTTTMLVGITSRKALFRTYMKT